MQGMMLAERPPDSGPSSSGLGGGGGGGAAAVSIGNYKGVMLCNRPFAGAAVSAQATGGPAKAAFVCGRVPDAMGNAAIKSENALNVKRTKKETALTRHRRWLHDLQVTKDALEKAYLDDIQAKEDSKQRFMEREAKMRQAVRAGRQSAAETKTQPPPAEAKTAGAPEPASSQTKDPGAKAAAAAVDAKAELSTDVQAAMKRREKQGKATRPMWAMDETAAKEATDQKEEDDTLELLEFAKNLDFDKYIDDMEVQTMIEQVKSRILELETMDEDQVAAEEVRGEARPHALTAESIARLQAKYGQSLGGGGAAADDDKPVDDDARSVARSVLSDNADLKNTHSQRSVAAIAQKKLATVGEENEGPTVTGGPRLVRHTDDDGTRLANKKEVHNLPYMHRNPSV